MATDNSQIVQLTEERDRYQAALDTSPTALSAGAVPTDADIENETRVRALNTRIQNAENQRLKNIWYGTQAPAKSETEGVDSSFIGTALNALASPLYGVVGGVEAALGQGTKKGFANIAENIKERESFGDMLRKNKVPMLLSAPLGFALDVAFDPVNWLTVGAAAAVPRTALGFVKGAARGGISGATRGAVAGLGSRVASLGAKTVGALTLGTDTPLRKKLAGTAMRYAKEFNTLVGRDVEAAAITRGVGAGVGTYRVKLGETIQQLMEKIPGGDRLFESLNYDSKGYFQLLKLKDSVERIGGTHLFTDGLTPAELDDILKNMPIQGELVRSLDELDTKFGSLADMGSPRPSLGGADSILDNLPPGDFRDMLIAHLDSQADDVAFALKNPGAVSTLDTGEQLARFAEESAQTDVARQQMDELMAQFHKMGDTTGIRWFDKAHEWARNIKHGDFKTGETAMDAYSSLISWFKQAHTGLSPSTFMTNLVSAPALMMMYGMKFTPGMTRDFVDAYKYLSGGNVARFVMNSGMFDQGSEWIRFMGDRPGTFARTFGMSPKYAVGRKLVNDIMQTGRDMGMSVSLNSAEATSALDTVMKEAGDELRKIMAEAVAPTKTHGAMSVASGAPLGRLASIVKKAKVKSAPSPSQMALELAAEGGPQLGTASWGGSEFIDQNSLRRFATKVAENAEERGGWWRPLNFMLNKTMTKYEQIDQGWRLAIAKRLTKDGITEGELTTMGRITEFNQGSIASKFFDKNGVQRFRLHPEKATEIASDILFNYAAMPPAIRMLRSLPVMGAPFASFMYGMLLRTAETLATNPAAFNRVTFALNSLSGGKGPLERKALETPYYKWYNNPSMLRLPFFDEYPIYLNTANILPYYTLNIFQPSERTYKETLPDNIVAAIDKSPLLKDPIGQLMLDYFIIPSMIRDSRPLNSFGQPLYPTDATSIQKTGYLARAAADVVAPGFIGLPVGVAAGLMAPQTATYLPGYRTRQMAQAVQGKTPIGVASKESSSSRTLRALSGYFGIPVQRMDTRVSNIKKQ